MTRPTAPIISLRWLPMWRLGIDTCAPCRDGMTAFVVLRVDFAAQGGEPAQLPGPLPTIGMPAFFNCLDVARTARRVCARIAEHSTYRDILFARRLHQRLERELRPELEARHIAMVAARFSVIGHEPGEQALHLPPPHAVAVYEDEHVVVRTAGAERYCASFCGRDFVSRDGIALRAAGVHVFFRRRSSGGATAFGDAGQVAREVVAACLWQCTGNFVSQCEAGSCKTQFYDWPLQAQMAARLQDTVEIEDVFVDEISSPQAERLLVERNRVLLRYPQ